MKKGRLKAALKCGGKDWNLRRLGYEFDLVVSRASFSTVYIPADVRFFRVFGCCCPPIWPPVCPPIDHQGSENKRRHSAGALKRSTETLALNFIESLPTLGSGLGSTNVFSEIAALQFGQSATLLDTNSYRPRLFRWYLDSDKLRYSGPIFEPSRHNRGAVLGNEADRKT